MALQVDLTDFNAHGIPIPNGYVRFRKTPEYVSMDVFKVSFRIEAYYDKAAADAGKQAINFIGWLMPEVTVVFDPNEDNAYDIVTKAYVAVKADIATYPELQQAVDV